MNRIVGAAVFFWLACYVALSVKRSYRKGDMPLLLTRGNPMFGGRWGINFNRKASPFWYWAAITINLCLALSFTLVAILFLTLKDPT